MGDADVLGRLSLELGQVSVSCFVSDPVGRGPVRRGGPCDDAGEVEGRHPVQEDADVRLLVLGENVVAYGVMDALDEAGRDGAGDLVLVGAGALGDGLREAAGGRLR